MSDCHSECDCGWPGPDYGPHDPDCHSYDVCDEGRWCDKHWKEAEAEMRVLYDREKREETDRQDIRDAGRGHLLRYQSKKWVLLNPNDEHSPRWKRYDPENE